MTNRQYRKYAFRHANFLINSDPVSNNTGIRLPACVMAAIYREFPLEAGDVRAPFGYAAEGDDELTRAYRKRARKLRRARQEPVALEKID